jgi:hypothetical protein
MAWPRDEPFTNHSSRNNSVAGIDLIVQNIAYKYTYTCTYITLHRELVAEKSFDTTSLLGLAPWGSK